MHGWDTLASFCRTGHDLALVPVVVQIAPHYRGAMAAALDHVRDLADFVTASPSSFHAAAEGARRQIGRAHV